MRCRTCKFLNVAPNKAGRIVPQPRKMYECLYVIPKPTDIPACIRLDWPPNRSWMAPDSGEGCPCWKQREKKSE